MPVAFILLHAGLALSSMVHQSVTYDEPAHLKFGRALLARQLVTDMQRMPVTALNAVPDLLLERFVPDASSRTRLFAARSVTVALSGVLAWLVFLWSKRLWGWRGGLFSLALYSLEPNLLAHARWVTNDMAASLFMLAAIVSFLRFLKDPSPRHMVISAMLTGCAQIAKHSALLLLPVFGVLAAIPLWAQPAPLGRARLLRAHVGQWSRHVAAFAVIVVLVINIGYLFQRTFTTFYRRDNISQGSRTAETASFRVTDVGGEPVGRLRAVPVPLPFVYVESLMLGVRLNATSTGHGPNYLLGGLSSKGWWYYFLVVLAFKLPLGLWLLLALSATDTIRRLRQGVLDDWGLMLLPAALVVLMSASTAQIGLRYVLPILPFLIVSLGRLVVAFRRRGWVYRSAVVTAVTWMAVSSLSFYPHYLSYFNELVGNRLRMHKILADSNVDWGQSDYYLDDYLSENTGRVIHVNPPTPVTGTVVVSLNDLVGVNGSREKYAWLRATGEPVRQIGYSWLVYEVGER